MVTIVNRKGLLATVVAVGYNIALRQGYFTNSDIVSASGLEMREVSGACRILHNSLRKIKSSGRLNGCNLWVFKDPPTKGDRLILDMWELRRSLEDKLGRKPTSNELADACMSKQRLLCVPDYRLRAMSRWWDGSQAI